jgi:cell division protein FtsB
MRLASVRLAWLAVALGVVGIAALSFLDGDSGVLAWRRYRDDLATARARIAELRQEVSQLEAEAQHLRADPLAQERAIREDLGLALPGDVVVVLPPSSTEP